MCCDGSLSPSCTCGYYQPEYVAPPPIQAPQMTANFSYEPNTDGTFDVRMGWNHVENTGFSVTLNKNAGQDPGPLVDTHNEYYVFKSIRPGVYYANMKVGIDNYWSDNITYWKIVVPTWYPPKPALKPANNNTNKVNVSPVDEIDNYNGGVSFEMIAFIGLIIYAIVGWFFQKIRDYKSTHSKH